MAVTITDRRTIYDEGEDEAAGWTPGSYGTTTTDVAEAAAAVAESYATTSGVAYFTGSAIDVSNTLIYVYLFNNALQGSWTTGATALFIGDGTNRTAFHMSGSDRKVFAHADGPTNWQCAVLDGSQAATMDTAGETTEVDGTFASMNLESIVDMGGSFITGSKALGGGYNVAVDILRYGNDGIRITAGGSGTEGTALEIATADRSTANQAAHGIFRELAPIAFGIQGPLTFGITTAATESRFIDSGISLVFEDRNVSNDKYYLNIEGNTSTTNVFELRQSTIASAGPYVSIAANTGTIDTIVFDGVTFSQLGNPITFSNLADATGHEVRNSTFDGCGQIDPGDITFEDNIISSSTEANGAVLLDADGSSNWTGLSFVRGTGGHGIYISATGTHTLDAITFSGFDTSNGQTNSAVFNDSGGSVTLEITGSGDSPTVRNGSGADTTITAAVATTFTGIKVESEIRIFDATTNYREDLDGEESVNGSLQSVSIVDGGGSYAVSDVLTGVSGTGTKYTLTVDAVDSGAITEVSITTAGDYSVAPTNPDTVTGGTGSGATFNTVVTGSFTYNGQAAESVNVIVFHLNYKEIRLSNFTIPSSDSSIPLSQITDRTYANP